MQLLRKGWSAGRVRARTVEIAHDLDAVGYVVRGSKPDDAAGVTDLVRGHLGGAPSFEYARSDGAVIVTAEGGEIAGIAVVRASLSPQQNVVVHVRALVTAPEHRGRGIASLALAVIPQVLGADLSPDVIFGAAASEHAVFFQRNGFDVLQPGERLDLGAHTDVLVDAAAAPLDTWFVRAP